jgi:hypothetical protein
VEQGGEVVKRAIAVIVFVVLHLVAACAPAAPAPTRTPEPTATPVEVLATKSEHLAGLWFNPAGASGRGLYYRFEAHGTVSWAYTLEDLRENPKVEGRFWFEGGIYYEEGQICVPIGSYRVYLDIDEGRAVGLRFEEIDDSDRSCYERSYERRVKYVRVD